MIARKKANQQQALKEEQEKRNQELKNKKANGNAEIPNGLTFNSQGKPLT
jgi:hypothetical protein